MRGDYFVNPEEIVIARNNILFNKRLNLSYAASRIEIIPAEKL